MDAKNELVESQLKSGIMSRLAFLPHVEIGICANGPIIV